MDKERHILIVEDSEADAQLIAQELQKGDLAHTAKWVRSKEELLKSLREYVPDIILCDYKMPSLDAPEVLKIVKERFPEIPLIVVSGTIGEEIAVEMIRCGAVDYVMKDRLARLVPAVRRAAKEVEEHAERKKVEEALRHSEEKLRSITDSAQDAILMMDPKGIISFWNLSAERILGYSAQEAVGKNLHQLLSPERFLPAQAAAFPEFQRTGKGSAIGKTLELAAIRKDGAEIVAALSLSAIKRADGWHAIGIIRDITEHQRMVEALKRSHEDLEVQVKERTAQLELTNQKLRMASEEAKRANKAKSEFLTNMSHELRTPLSSIIGFSEVLYDEKFGPLNERQKRYAENVLSSGRHLLALINDVLDLSRVESGKMVLEASSFSLKNFLEEVLRLIKGLAASKKVKLSFEIPEDLGEIQADQRKVKQVIYNLLSNAIKFTPAGGEVGLRTRRDGAGIEITVWDTGIGIPPEDLENVFEAFRRLGDVYTQETEGAGLGLTISKKIVELHGGRIWIESGGTGMGTTAKFTLPATGA